MHFAWTVLPLPDRTVSKATAVGGGARGRQFSDTNGRFVARLHNSLPRVVCPGVERVIARSDGPFEGRNRQPRCKTARSSDYEKLFIVGRTPTTSRPRMEHASETCSCPSSTPANSTTLTPTTTSPSFRNTPTTYGRTPNCGRHGTTGTRSQPLPHPTAADRPPQQTAKSRISRFSALPKRHGFSALCECADQKPLGRGAGHTRTVEQSEKQRGSV